jgi:hypothetical protein
LGDEAVVLESTLAPGRRVTLEAATNLNGWQTVPEARVTYLSDWLTKAGEQPSFRSPVYQVWQIPGTNSWQQFYRVTTR